MNTKLCGQGDTTTEEEKGVERIKSDRNQAVAHKALVECHQHEVYKGQHGEDCDEYAVIDRRRIAAEGVRDHVADEGQY